MSLDTHLERKATAHDLPCGGCDPDDACEYCRNNFCEECGEQLAKVYSGLLQCSVCLHTQEESSDEKDSN